MAGRRPIPTKLKLINGNPGRRPLNDNEPEPNQGIPTMPIWLEQFPVAVSEWNRESKELSDMGILTMAEQGVLAMRCYLASQIQSLALEIEKDGRTITFRGMKKTNPKCNQLKDLMTEYRQNGTLLGLDPSSRSRIKVDRKPKQSRVQEFLSRKSG